MLCVRLMIILALNSLTLQVLDYLFSLHTWPNAEIFGRSGFLGETPLSRFLLTINELSSTVTTSIFANPEADKYIPIKSFKTFQLEARTNY